MNSSPVRQSRAESEVSVGKHSKRKTKSQASLVCFFFSSRRRHTRLQGDWSSDVCSSDLLGRVRARDERAGAWRGVCHRIAGISPVRPVSGVRGELPVVAGDTEGGEAREGIGRASCRERGEISVGAVSLKKKKKECDRSAL